jgi:hypothetical protein
MTHSNTPPFSFQGLKTLLKGALFSIGVGITSVAFMLGAICAGEALGIGGAGGFWAFVGLVFFTTFWFFYSIADDAGSDS